MAFKETVDRKEINFTNHALDRWWERCEDNQVHGRTLALDLLREKLDGKKVTRSLPEWSRVNKFHRAVASGFIVLDDESGFVVNQNPNGDYVAVTFIDRISDD